MRFRWWKFGTYLGIGLLILGTWGTFNYINFLKVELKAEKEIKTNVTMINETIEEIEVEQQELRMVQRVYSEPEPSRSPAASMPIFGLESGAPAPAPPPPSGDPVVDELQARIDELEKEKEELIEEESVIKSAIRDSISVFSGVKVENPLVNAIIIPIFLYIIKKLLDFGFVRLEEWYEEKHGEKA